MTQAQLQESTTVLIVRDRDPLLVETSILTADSPVFRFILEECAFEEEDLTDFSAEAVEVFLTLLRDKKMVDIEENLFREVNKMGVAFKIDWLMLDCLHWIKMKIVTVSNEAEKTFVFDESYYVLKRLARGEYMDMFVGEFGRSDSITFISRYLEDFDNLETAMLYPLLQLAGSNYKVIFDTLTKSVAKNPGLNKNALFVLQNISTWCFEIDRDSWASLFDKIAELPEITVSDFRIVSKLQNMAWQKAKSNNKKEKEAFQTAIYDENIAADLFHCYDTLVDIVTEVSLGKTDTMLHVVMATCYALKKYMPSQEEMVQFVSDLERLCQEKQIQRVPRKLIDLIIPVLKHSTKDTAKILLLLLTSIRQSTVLSSSHRENIFIKRCTEIKVFYSEESTWTYSYRFKHPATGRCSQPGECGFILKYRIHYDHRSSSKGTLELVTESEYYVGTGVHYHDVISARDMCEYGVVTITLPDGTKLDTVIFGELWGRWWWEKCKWLPADTKWEFEGYYVLAYNVSNYMVAK